MRTPNFASYHVRKWYTQIEDTLANETGALADGEPIRKIVIAAAVHNPYAGRFSEDLDLIIADSPKLGEEFGRRIAETPRAGPIESYGKACLVGSTVSTNMATPSSPPCSPTRYARQSAAARRGCPRPGSAVPQVRPSTYRWRTRMRSTSVPTTTRLR